MEAISRALRDAVATAYVLAELWARSCPVGTRWLNATVSSLAAAVRHLPTLAHGAQHGTEGRRQRWALVRSACSEPHVIGQRGTPQQYLLADGAKIICDPNATLINGRGCLVVSVGSNGDAAFEKAVHALSPWCQIDVMDGTLVGNRAHLRRGLPNYVHFTADNYNSTTWERYRGRSVDVLKIDCEGCELTSLAPWLENVCTSQILIEHHGYIDNWRIPLFSMPWEDRVAAHANMSRLHAALVRADYEPFHAQANDACGMYSGARCMEIAWRRRSPCGKVYRSQ